MEHPPPDPEKATESEEFTDSEDETDLSHQPDVSVLCIPCDGSRLKIYTVPSLEVKTSDQHELDSDTANLENSLGHVPNLRGFRHYIDLNHRFLFKKDLCPGARRKEWWDEGYHIYKCVSETSAWLPKNKYRGLDGVRAYGDAFIFRVSWMREIGGHPRAVYGSMWDFKDGVDRRGRALRHLEEMLRW